MLLSIPRLIEEGRVEINPFQTKLRNPLSYDLRLGRYFLILDRKRGFKRVKVNKAFILRPRQFVLASSIEIVHIRDAHIVGFVSGRSSIARLGLQIEGASWVWAGWKGAITFEIANLTDFEIVLPVGLPIAQIVFMEAEMPFDYKGRYAQSKYPVASKYSELILLNNAKCRKHCCRRRNPEGR